MEEEKIVINDSDEAAKYVTNISGWVSRHGRFYGDHEDSEKMARWDGCTHKKCDCGKLMTKHYLYCRDCRREKERVAFEKMPSKPWDGKSMLYSQTTDTYYSSPDDVYEDDAFDENGNPELIICEPNTLTEVDASNLGIDDVLPEDHEYEDCVPKEVLDAIDNLNNAIRENQEAISWSPGKYRLVDDNELAKS